MWLVSDRSVMTCYYPIGSVETHGKFEMVASSKGIEEFAKKYAADMGKDVIADSILDYWCCEPKIDERTGEVIGTKVINLNMFDPKGRIPKIVVAAISAAASQPIQRL